MASYSIPIYGLASASLIPAGKGTEYQDARGLPPEYMGFEMSATKRMANSWMARLGFSTNDWREYFDDPNTSQTDPTSVLGTPNIDGGYVVSASGGSGKSGIYMVQPKYQFIANGSYQAPWDINFGVNFLIRQGYPMPWFRRKTGIADPNSSTKHLLAVGGLRSGSAAGDVDPGHPGWQDSSSSDRRPTSTSTSTSST